MIYVVPAPGLSVRDPKTYAQLPAAGAWVERDQHWLRRLEDGDVVETAPPGEDE